MIDFNKEISSFDLDKKLSKKNCNNELYSQILVQELIRSIINNDEKAIERYIRLGAYLMEDIDKHLYEIDSDGKVSEEYTDTLCAMEVLISNGDERILQIALDKTIEVFPDLIHSWLDGNNAKPKDKNRKEIIGFLSKYNRIDLLKVLAKNNFFNQEAIDELLKVNITDGNTEFLDGLLGIESIKKYHDSYLEPYLALIKSVITGNSYMMEKKVEVLNKLFGNYPQIKEEIINKDLVIPTVMEAINKRSIYNKKEDRLLFLINNFNINLNTVVNCDLINKNMFKFEYDDNGVSLEKLFKLSANELSNIEKKLLEKENLQSVSKIKTNSL